ncbi:26070_t:CDS:2, partial [Dentiscutata erythropus]
MSLSTLNLDIYSTFPYLDDLSLDNLYQDELYQDELCSEDLPPDPDNASSKTSANIYCMEILQKSKKLAN